MNNNRIEGIRYFSVKINYIVVWTGLISSIVNLNIQKSGFKLTFFTNVATAICSPLLGVM